jgi:hypothetical protein
MAMAVNRRKSALCFMKNSSKNKRRRSMVEDAYGFTYIPSKHLSLQARNRRPESGPDFKVRPLSGKKQ